ncbi:iron ABC transporter permease [Paenibacillus sambharensis]|uniref:Iron ABC transporter permease n=1 Tax=Paenibacillus sambharensis TaxID=1803190 RepID=A0A2W1LWS6_9BACL|nr:iron ABC transporter permease [Paenibacillus sambharensis]PZD96231.1 iron ABC transporter permease [Paenibacillus sambharensis]
MKLKITAYGGAAMLLLAVSVVVTLSFGSAGLSVGKVWAILLHQLPWNADSPPQWTRLEEAVVLQVRLSRVILAVLVGACLGLAGAGFQGVLRNPLADPYTLGVASGSSVGAAFIILMGFQAVLGMWTVPAIAFATGLATLLAVFWLGRTEGRVELETLILSGVIIQAFLGSFVSLMISMSNSVVNEILYWLMGSLAKRGWEHVLLMIPFALLGLPAIAAFAQPMNLMVLGERQAAHLGVRVERTKLAVLVISTLLTAAAVSVTGVIGFVGLVVPHLVRLIAGPDYRLIVPLSALLGGIYVLWADTLARMALSPKEIPLGVLTALVGAPFFAYLLKRRKAGLKEGSA